MTIGPLLGAVILALGVGGVDDLDHSPELALGLTIRNATREDVSFRLTRVAGDHRGLEYVLRPDAVGRFADSIFADDAARPRR